MDTTEFILDMSIAEGTNIISDTKEELSWAFNYIELTRSLQEIYQWYQIFEFNLINLKQVVNDCNFISINAYTISLVSSGKNLIDLIESCVKRSYGENAPEYEKMKSILAEEYDKCFHYRLITRLRNFSQHGHIPISLREGRPRLDMIQICNTPHYSFNAKLKNEVDEFIEELRKDNISFNLAFEPVMCDYTISIFKIFNSFCNIIQGKLVEECEYIQEMVRQWPEVVIHKHNPDINGVMFIYAEDDIAIHCINVNEKPLDLFFKWKKYGRVMYKNEKKIVKCLKRQKS